MPKMTINPIHEYGDKVYFIADPLQSLYLVVGYQVNPNGLQYMTSNGTEEPIVSFAFELTTSQYEFVKKEIFPTDE